MSRAEPTPSESTNWADEVRAEAKAQWSHDPAGALAAETESLGTPESFARVESYRYDEQPWMHETFEFERYADREVLEIGVGLGTDHLQFARAGANLTGIDLTPRCVELTRSRLEQEGKPPNVHVMDAETLAFPDASFDAVYSFGVLHHIPDMEASFREIRRVLRPGGVFVGALYNRHSAFHARIQLERLLLPRYRRQPIGKRIEHSTGDAAPYVRLLTRRELARILREAGFTRVSITKRHLGLGRYRRYLPGVDALGGRLAGWYLVHEAS